MPKLTGNVDINVASFQFLPPVCRSQLQLIGDFGCDVLEGDGGARDTLEADAIEREAGQLAYFHLPLDEAVLTGVAVNAEEQEALALLVVTIVGV